jgi:hypothetical protein
MSHSKSRGGVSLLLGTTAGAFGVAALMSTAAAPTARADDFSGVVSIVEVDLSSATNDFNSALSNLEAGQLGPGFASFLDGVNNDLLAAPQNLVAGTAEVLDNESVSPPLTWNLVPEANFAGGLAQAEIAFTQGENTLSQVVTDLAGGDYGTALYAEFAGLDLLAVAPLDDVLLGSLASL